MTRDALRMREYLGLKIVGNTIQGDLPKPEQQVHHLHHT